jgi:coenzyme Q-binding protein COQ10
LRHSLIRELPYTPEQLFDLVGDVEAYPQFVRWVSELKVLTRRQEPDGVVDLDAEARVKFSVINERFATRVRLDRPHLAVDVALLSGPFSKLENHWRFRPRGRRTEVTFDIEVEFRSRLLRGLLAANVERAAKRLVRCFEDRAAQLYGGK